MYCVQLLTNQRGTKLHHMKLNYSVFFSWIFKETVNVVDITSPALISDGIAIIDSDYGEVELDGISSIILTEYDSKTNMSVGDFASMYKTTEIDSKIIKSFNKYGVSFLPKFKRKHKLRKINRPDDGYIFEYHAAKHIRDDLIKYYSKYKKIKGDNLIPYIKLLSDVKYSVPYISNDLHMDLSHKFSSELYDEVVNELICRIIFGINGLYLSTGAFVLDEYPSEIFDTVSNSAFTVDFVQSEILGRSYISNEFYSLRCYNNLVKFVKTCNNKKEITKKITMLYGLKCEWKILAPHISMNYDPNEQKININSKYFLPLYKLRDMAKRFSRIIEHEYVHHVQSVSGFTFEDAISGDAYEHNRAEVELEPNAREIFVELIENGLPVGSIKSYNLSELSSYSTCLQSYYEYENPLSNGVEEKLKYYINSFCDRLSLIGGY